MVRSVSPQVKNLPTSLISANQKKYLTMQWGKRRGEGDRERVGLGLPPGSKLSLGL